MSTHPDEPERGFAHHDVMQLTHNADELAFLQDAMNNLKGVSLEVLATKIETDEGTQSRIKESAAAYGDYGDRVGQSHKNWYERAVQVQRAGGNVIRIVFDGTNPRQERRNRERFTKYTERKQPKLTEEESLARLKALAADFSHRTKPGN